MQVYVRETLHVLDYQDKIVDTIFNSEDHITPGYAYNISITESNTGYSDLKFDMPNTILTDTADKIKNPKLKLLTPLVKLRYHRQIYYMGEQSITVREPKGYGDRIEYIEVTYNKGDVIENYIMDYIVQPVDKKRNSLAIDTTFTAMDYPRFNLSKKRVGMVIDDNTISEDWSIITDIPMDSPGKIKYVRWDGSLNSIAGNPDIPTVWDPENATEYPLKKENIENLMDHTEIWPYGLLATAFYWPIVSTYRYKGIMYKKDGYLVLHLYDFFALATEGIDPELSVGRYSWEWTQLYKNSKYLTPNNARNYLGYILEGTNWSIAQRPKRNEYGQIIEGEYEDDVDIIQTEIPCPKGSIDATEWVDLQANVNMSNGNCYNGITSVAKALQVYPIFDCVNRTVALRQFAGSNYGLVYALGRNIKDDSTKHDGEKVITKLYCTGGQDYNGDAKINIGDANRTYIKEFSGFYAADTDLPSPHYSITCNDCSHSFNNNTMVQECPECHGHNLTQVFVGVEGYWAIVDPKFTSEDFEYQTYELETYEDQGEEKIRLKPVTMTAHDMNTKDFWEAGNNREVYFWDNTNQEWVLGEKQETGLWTYGEYIVDPITGTQGGTWNPNDDAYINCRSPWGTNYILNLRWMYQNKWITKEQILELYQKEWLINDYNLNFIDKYKEDYMTTRQLYNEAVNNYDIEQDKYESTLNAMMNKYYIDDNKPSEGTQHCFHIDSPVGTFDAIDDTDGRTKKFIKIFHCYSCETTKALEPDNGSEPTDITTCGTCGSTDVANNKIYIPRYVDFEFTPAEGMYPYGTDYNNYRDHGYPYNPRLKGYFFKLVTTLDRQSGIGEHEEGKDISYYESIVSLIEPIAYRETSQGIDLEDDYRYAILDQNGHSIYVRSAAGQIDVWNQSISDYITAYGKMLSFKRKMDVYLHKIEMLDEAFNEWSDKVAEINAYIQEHFGDYLVEGNYTNDEQPYIELLFKEGLEASNKFSVPEVTYNLGVIDSSGLIEYRRPTITRHYCANCDYMSYSPFVDDICPRCGHNLVITENDVYNDLVKSLHSVGQIVPKAGDYVTIYDEPMGFYGIPGLITKITRNPDNPVNNKIEVDTSYTDDEELVGNIITATNTVLNNTDIYTRTAVLKSDGTIDPNSIRESLDDSNANITIVGTDGNVLLDSSGLRATDATHEGYGMKYTGKGIFNTTNNGATWESLMTPQGINATYINSGTIDTNKLNIVSGKSAKVIVDQYGLVVKETATKSHHITKFDKNAAMSNAGYAVGPNSWGTTNNIASFIGVDAENNPLIYTKGFLVAEEGSNIANWITSNNGFYHLTGQGKKDLWLSPTGMNRSEYSDNASLGEGNTSFMIYAADKFGVSTEGKMYATGAVISGSGSFSGNISADSGNIGGWTISNGNLTAGNITLNQNGSISGGSTYAWSIGTDGTASFSNATISGNITANSGRIGNWYVSSGAIKYNNQNNYYLGSDGSIKFGKFSVNTSGNVTCTNLTANGNGQIGGWTIGSDTLSAGDLSGIGLTTLYSAGRIVWRRNTGGGFFVMGAAGGGGEGTNHPYVSALNIGYNANANGIVFRSGSGWSEPGSALAQIKLGSSYFTITGRVGEPARKVQILGGSGSNGIIIDNTVISSINNGGSMYANANCALQPESGYYAYVGSTSDSGNRIATSSSGPSSLNVKKNLVPLDKEYDDLYEDIRKVKAYNYDYKYKGVKDELEKDYGFIIDEIEATNHLSKYVRNYEVKRWIDGDKLVKKENERQKDPDLETITIKEWERDAYIKGLFVMIKTLQHKIDQLEEQIKKEKTN